MKNVGKLYVNQYEDKKTGSKETYLSGKVEFVAGLRLSVVAFKDKKEKNPERQGKSYILYLNDDKNLANEEKAKSSPRVEEEAVL